MSSNELAQSLHNGAPYDAAEVSTRASQTATANDFGVIKWSGGAAGTETTSHADAIPTHWYGREVGMICTGGVCYVAFSKSQSAAVDRTVAATNAGASVSVGLPLPNSLSVETRVRLPVPTVGDTLYFVRQSDTVGCIVYMRIHA